MSDGLHLNIRYQATLRDLALVDRSVSRATMWGLRESGRKVKAAARRQAPVYKGQRKDIPRGRLKKSISSARSLRRTADGGWSLTIAPRGYPARAYAPMQEARTPFMEPASQVVSAQAPAIFARAWSRATRRR